LTGFARAALIHRLGDLVTANAQRLARLEVQDSGKLYPNEPETEMGPVANEPQYEQVLRYLKIAVQEGANMACGGHPDDELGGFFVRPTVLTDVGPESAVGREVELTGRSRDPFVLG
jgi:acyl-CoA reductase-like NAD-dependent aldehyde dehydrogenase